MYGLHIALALVLFACVGGFFIRAAKWKLICGLLQFLPLLLVAALYWSQSRGGCAGGTCGPATMLLGLFGAVALLPAATGAVFLVQAASAGVARLLLGGRAKTRATRLCVAAMPLLLAAGGAAALYRAEVAQPSAACRARLYPATVAGTPLRVPLGQEVSIAGPSGSMELADLREAHALCRTGKGQTVPAREVVFDNDRWVAIRPYSQRLLAAQLLFGPRSGRNRTSLCDGPLGPSARPLFCQPHAPGARNYGPSIQSRKLTLKTATTPLEDWTARPALATAPAQDRTVPARSTLGRFTVELMDHGWTMRSGDTAGDPLRMPRIIAYCRRHPDGYAQCRTRERMSPGLAAYGYLEVDGGDAASVAPVLNALSAFLNAIGR